MPPPAALAIIPAMNPKISPSRAPVELCSRSGDGIEVTLLWTPGDDRLTVAVVDTRLHSSFVLEPEPGEALEVFHHPYPRAAALGILDRAEPAGRVDRPASSEPATAGHGS
jgi:hypothetical protein